MAERLDWTGGTPRSPRFDDIYFSPEDGLAETQTVFLQGCDLPEAWRGRRRFVVGETGFGTGLNILALTDLWRRTRPAADAILNVFSIEAFPIARDDAARALQAFPALNDLAEALVRQWPGGRRGFHRIEWPDARVILDLAVMEAEAALSAWSGRADAWFLDGFAPSKNPEMWRPEVLKLIAARSNPGARLGTFTVAGMVRRGLAEAGFTVEKAPGFGGKKQRLEGRLSGAPPSEAPPQRVAIIGAGIAGAALARAFRRLGVQPLVIDSAGPGAGASGNPAALVTPRLDAGLGGVAELHAQAFARAAFLYRDETPDAVIAEGALQLETQPRDAARFAKIAAWDGFDPGALIPLDGPAAAERLQELGAPGALAIEEALVVEPASILASWLGKAPLAARVERLERVGDLWRLMGEEGVVAEAEVVCIAAGPASSALVDGLRLQPVRGQATLAATPFTGEPAAWGGYAIPTRDGVLFGATHARGDASADLRWEDDAYNLIELGKGRPVLAARLADAPKTARAAVRAATPDHLPLAGAAPGAPGLHVLAGLGGRGFTLAPLLAEAVAAEALGGINPSPQSLRALIDPARFLKA